MQSLVYTYYGIGHTGSAIVLLFTKTFCVCTICRLHCLQIYGSSLIQVGAPNYSGIQRSRCVHIRVLEILGESMFNWPKVFSVTNMSLK